MTRGPKPTPTNLIAFTGGKQRTAKKVKDREQRGAVEFDVSVPPPPDDMPERGKTIWLETATKLAKLRVMTEADTAALELYVHSWMRWKDATKQIADTSLIIMSPKNYPLQNPLLPIANKAQEQCLKILTEFGLTPSSRTRVNRE